MNKSDARSSFEIPEKLPVVKGYEARNRYSELLITLRKESNDYQKFLIENWKQTGIPNHLIQKNSYANLYKRIQEEGPPLQLSSLLVSFPASIPYFDAWWKMRIPGGGYPLARDCLNSILATINANQLGPEPRNIKSFPDAIRKISNQLNALQLLSNQSGLAAVEEALGFKIVDLIEASKITSDALSEAHEFHYPSKEIINTDVNIQEKRARAEINQETLKSMIERYRDLKNAHEFLFYFLKVLRSGFSQDLEEMAMAANILAGFPIEILAGNNPPPPNSNRRGRL